MNLEQNIKEQYSKRSHLTSLYTSTFSQMADAEKRKKIKKLLDIHLPSRENKTILEIGAGQGHNVSMLMECGFQRKNISLNELLPDRIQMIRENHPDLRLYEGNALNVNFDESFDCVFQSTVFTSILNDTSRKQLASQMWGLLKPGGIILWYDFIYNNPKNPYVKKVSVPELEALFPAASESEIRKVTLAPPIGRRVGKLYPFFNLPFLRSHVLAVFKK